VSVESRCRRRAAVVRVVALLASCRLVRPCLLRLFRLLVLVDIGREGGREGGRAGGWGEKGRKGRRGRTG